jgi:hypothetical protein
VPSELRKDFYALSGLFYVADTHFEIFYKERLKSKIGAKKLIKSKKDMFDIELNLDSFSAYLRSKFKNRVNANLKKVSILIDDLNEAGYNKIGEIDRLIDMGMMAFINYEKDNPPRGTDKFVDVGVVRILFEIMDVKYFEISTKKYKKLIKRDRYVKYHKYAKKT